MVAASPSILVVDDEHDFVDTLCANLEIEGYRTMSAADGMGALDVLAAEPDISLVLLDVRMPRMNGIEVLERIRSSRPGLPVVMITAYALQDLEERALDLGIFTILQKPLDTNLLLLVIARALRTPSVLIVDTRDGVGEQAEAILRESGHRVAAAATIDEALSVVRSGVFDAALLALSSTQEILSMLSDLRAAEPSLAIVILVREPPPDLLAEAPRLGISAWLPELLDRSQLLRVLASIRAGEGKN